MNITRKMTAVFGAALLLTALASCDLYQGINLAWDIKSVTPAPAPAPVGFTRVTYTAQNLGKYDLKGVNLRIGVDVTGTGTYPISEWTSNFDVKQGEMVSGSLQIFTGTATAYGATVVSVDMNSPSG